MKKTAACAVIGLLAAIGVFVGAAEKQSTDSTSLITNGNFEQPSGNAPTGFTLRGDATYQYLGDPRKDASSRGVAFHSGRSGASGEVGQIVNIPAGTKAYRFDFRGLAQDGFALTQMGKLQMRVDFLGDSDKSYDGKSQDIYALVQQARHDLAVNGDNRTSGAATWRTYSMEFIIPFAQVTRLRLSVSFDHGSGQGMASDFFVDDFDLTPLATPAMAQASQAKASHGQVASLDHLLPIGGRWFYATQSGENAIPDQFDASNADRLIYNDGQYETPFAGNMSTWLRVGDRDSSGQVVTADTLVPDNVVVRFDQTSMIIHTRDLPNHPTGKFPQTSLGRGGNPNYITEQDETYYIPLNPQERPGHTVTDLHNQNRALNMGPIGIAANGVVFFNPFDAGSADASNFMDACCGHPNQDGMYHYHKYPICINTPWADDGEEHSQLLGWAFDGFPIYGPYESKGVMAKDLSGDEKLNGFNMHYDAQRGWHYHVTPGTFPYIIGGYWGTPDARDVHHPRGPMMGAENDQHFVPQFIGR